jgi:xylitol oxidase
MNKREFLKTSGAFLTSTLLSGFAAGETTGPRTNWAGNLTYHTDNLLTPKSVEETQQIVKATPKLRALGSRHCFNTIADSTAAQISLTALDSMVIDADAKTVTVGDTPSITSPPCPTSPPSEPAPQQPTAPE